MTNKMKLFGLTALAIVATSLLLNAQTPTPASRSTALLNQNESANAQSKDKSRKDASLQTMPRGWHLVNGQWIHSDGYKYADGRVIAIGSQPHARAPKPPSKDLLESVKSKPSPTPDPKSAAAKAAEKERNLQARPASQTGSHL
jgi:hypothetical protein